MQDRVLLKRQDLLSVYLAVMLVVLLIPYSASSATLYSGYSFLSI